MRILIFIFLIALAVTAFSTPLIRRFAIWLGFVDVPATRKLHREPMPMMGGVAIIGGAFLAFLLLSWTVSTNITNRQVVGMLLASTVVAFVGLWDDRRSLPASVKLGGQFVGFLILIYFGVQVQLPVPSVINILITFIWLTGISNAINFLDNMDGLSAGVSAVAAAFIFVMAAFNGQHLVGALAAAVLGACLGFLRYNFKPAQIFMGDAGALFLGFLLAVLALQLRFPENSNRVTWMVPVLILGLPIFDTSLVVVSRLRRGVNPFTTAGKDHISHRLVNLGLSQREAVLTLYLICCAFGLVALLMTRMDILEAYAIASTLFLLGAWAIWRLELRRDRRLEVEK